MTVESEKMLKPEFDYDEFLEKASSYRYQLQKEKEIKSKRHQTMSALGAAAVNLVGMLTSNNGSESDPRDSVSQLLTTDLANDVIFIRAGKRRLTITILSGVGSDSDLPNPRHENCGQIFAYSFMSDQDTASLVSRLRIYNNGDISDGEITWSLKDGAEGCYSYLSSLISDCLFALDMTWTRTENLPKFLDQVPIVGGEVHLEHLRRTSGQYSIKPAQKPAEK
ncbi:MAG: hypothetical protein K8F91_18755 [Candidatus Obscuribacterales bacterium]|nr:hypothetical protein [Candidatus Obscuribacterales bacterium]